MSCGVRSIDVTCEVKTPLKLLKSTHSRVSARDFLVSICSPIRARICHHAGWVCVDRTAFGGSGVDRAVFWEVELMGMLSKVGYSW